ncbi:phytase [Lentzea sp. NPDC059081]|uniref:phytase n=1 Tax=Lentzea sp. NPDC059081 TaxID=3346719 RepID=UPI0036826722
MSPSSALALVPLFLTAPATPVITPTVITPTVVTQTFAEPADADDPAIWVNPRNADRSVVLGTLKEGGLAAFDLNGRTITVHPAPQPPTPDAKPGRFNNVDVLGDLAFVSDRGRDRIRVFQVDERGVRDVTNPATKPVFSRTEAEVDDQHTVYGLAAGKVNGKDVVVTSRRNETSIALLQVVKGLNYNTRKVSTLDLPSTFTLPDGRSWTVCGEPGEGPQVEGMVIDERTNTLYAAQEDVGIWRIPLRSNGFGQPQLVDKVRTWGAPQKYNPDTEECEADGPNPGFGGKWLEADAEGLTIADDVLLASSQGDSRFVAYRKADMKPLKDFRVKDVEHSDGADIVLGKLNLLVVHDGERPDGTGFAFIRF